jgi:antitoxin (DNA-binding transcriptional repressor) of toxin-antitoxin stability system
MELRVSVEQAATSLGEMLERVNARGEAVIIERDGRPVGRLVAVPPLAVRQAGHGTKGL